MAVPMLPLHPHGRCFTTYIFRKNLFTKDELARLEMPEIPARGQLERMSIGEGVRQIKKDALAAGIRLTDVRAEKIRKAVYEYSGESYGRIRAFQLGGVEGLRKYVSKYNKYIVWSETLLENVRSWSKGVEEYLKFAPRFKGTLYRGFGTIDSITSFSQLKAGDMVDMQGTSSWTNVLGRAEGFGEVIFECPKISRGASITHLAKYNEQEILVSRLSRFRVLSEPVTIPGWRGNLHILVEEL